MKTAMIPASQLQFGNTDSRPVSFDWSNGYAETWEFWEARQSEDGKTEASLDGESDGFDGPMMNYYYPLECYDETPEADAEKLRNLPLCIVRIEETGMYGLALTGGGMDLSWEICEAFMRLGFLPPVHFCRLPAMAGRGQSQRDRWIIAACRRSLRANKLQVCRSLRYLREEFKAS
jgi:hypothetical protein